MNLEVVHLRLTVLSSVVRPRIGCLEVEIRIAAMLRRTLHQSAGTRDHFSGCTGSSRSLAGSRHSVVIRVLEPALREDPEVVVVVRTVLVEAVRLGKEVLVRTVG